MARPSFLLCLLAVGLHLGHAAPVQDQQCNIVCRNVPNQKFHLTPKSILEYDWEAQTKIEVGGKSTTGSSTVQLKGKVTVIPKSECDIAIRLSGTSIKSPNGKAIPTGDLEGAIVRIGYQDGAIETFCVPPQLSPSSANILRGVASSLQNTLPSLVTGEYSVVEVDVSGRCPTVYNVEASGSNVKVRKTRDLNTCSDRQDVRHIAESIKYDGFSKYQSIPVFSTAHKCKQELQDGFISQVQCEETYTLCPTHNIRAANIEVTTSLRFTGKTPIDNRDYGVANVVSDIHMDHSGKDQHGSTTDAVNIIRQLCSSVKSNVDPKAAGLFSKLVHELRTLSKSELQEIRQQIQSGNMCPSKPADDTDHLFFHALASAGSTESVNYAGEIIREGHDAHKAYYYHVLMHMKHPNTETLEEVQRLLAQDTSREALLAASNVVHHFYHEHEENNPQANAIVNKIASLLTPNCKSRGHKEEDQNINVLKAFGNIHHLSDEVASKVVDCMRQENLPWRVRFAAFDAFRLDPCNKEIKKSAKAILENHEEEAEVRIVAYRLLTRCPCGKDIQTIQNIIDHDEVNQVLGYISSHVKSIQESDCPDKAKLKKVLNQIHLKEHYPFDPLKYSAFYGEHVFDYGKSRGFAGQAEVVYSTKSFVPRFLSFNATVHAFGKTINAFEVGVLLEGLEHSAETLMGPKGLLRNGDKYEMLNDGRHHGHRSRHSRALPPPFVSDQEIDAISDKVNVEKELRNEAAVDFYFRRYGKEEFWGHVRSSDFDPENRDGWVGNNDFENYVDAAKNKQVDKSVAVTFADASLCTPTIAGVPLILDVIGSAVFGIKLDSKVDLKQIKENPASTDMHLEILPSLTTEIAYSVGVEFAQFEAGLHSTMSGHAATGGSVTVKSLGGKGVDIKMGLPNEKVDVLELETEVFFLERAGDNEAKTPVTYDESQSYKGEGCSRPFLGMKYCASYDIPNLVKDCAFTTPGHIKMSSEKDDPQMEGYHVRYTYDLDDPNNEQVSFLLETPGASEEKMVSVKFDYVEQPHQKATFELVAPKKSVKVNYVNSDTAVGVEGWATRDGKKYYGKINMDISTQAKKTTYSPKIEYSGPSEKIQEVLSGRVIYVKNKKLDVSLKTGAAVKEYHVSVKGVVQLDKNQAAQTLKLSVNNFQLDSYAGKFSVDGFAAKEGPESYAVHLDTKYGKEDHSIVLNGKFISGKEGDYDTCKFTYDFQSSQHPECNSNVKFANKMRRRASELDVSYDLTVTYKGHPHTLTSDTRYKYTSTHDFEAHKKITVLSEHHEIDVTLEANVKVKDDTLDHDWSVLYGGKKVAYRINVHKGSHNDYTMDSQLEYPGRTVTLKSTRETQSEEKVRYYALVDSKPGNRHELNAYFTWLHRGDTFKQDFSVEFKCTQLSHPVHFHVASSRQPHEITGEINFDYENVKYVSGKLLCERPNQRQASGTMKLNVKDYLEVDWTMQMLEKNYKEEVVIFFPSLNRKITRSATYVVAGDNHDLDIDLKWDANRDPSQRLHIVSRTVHVKNPNTITSQNKIEYLDKTVHVNMHGTIGESYVNALHTGVIEVITPSGKKAVLSVDTHAIDTPAAKSLLLKTKYVATTGKEYGLNMESKAIPLVSYHPSAKSFQVITDLTLRSGDKDVKTHVDFKHEVPSAQETKCELTVKLSGAVIPEPLEYNMIGSRNGDHFSIDSTVKRGGKEANLKVHGKVVAGKKKDFDITTEITLPQGSEFQHLKVRSVYVCDYVKDHHLNFDFGNEIEYNHKHLLSRHVTLHCVPGNVDGKITVRLGDHPERGIAFKGHHDPDNQAASGDISITYDENKVIRTEIQVQKNDKGLFKLDSTITTPIQNYETISVDFEHHVAPEGGIMDHELEVKVGSRVYKFSQKLQHSQGHLSINSDASSPKHKVHFDARFDKKSDTECTLTAHYSRNEKAISVQASVDYKNVDEFEVRGTVDGAAYEINQWDLRAARTLQGGRKQIQLDVKNAGKVVVHTKLDYTKTSDANRSNYDGTLEYQHEEKKGSGKFAVDYGTLKKDKDGEVGHSLNVDLSLDFEGRRKPFKGILELKRTDKERRYFRSYCREADCHDTEIVVKDKSTGPKETNCIFAIIHKETEGGQTITRAFEVTTIRKKKICEHEVKIVVNKEKGYETGYKVVANPKEWAISVTYLDGSVTYLGATISPTLTEVALIPDKTHSPNDKLSLTIAATKRGANTKDYKITLKHAALPRDLSITGTVEKEEKDGVYVYHVTDVMDIYQKPEQQVTHDFQFRYQPVEGGFKWAADIKGESKFLNMNLNHKMFLTFYPKEFGIGDDLSFNWKGQDKHYDFKYMLAKDYSNLKILGTNGKELSVLSRWHLSEAANHLGYVENTRVAIPDAEPVIFLSELSTSPPRVHSRVYRETSPEHYYDLDFGVVNDRTVRAGVRHNDGQKEYHLSDALVYLNNSRLLFVELQWDRQAIVDSMKELQERRDKGRNAAVRFIRDTWRDFSTDVKEIHDTMTDMMVDCAPVRNAIRKQLQDVRQRHRDSPGYKQLKEDIEEAEKLIHDDILHLDDLDIDWEKVVKDICDHSEKMKEELKRKAEQIEQFLENDLPPLVEKILEDLEKLADYIQEKLEKFITEELEKFEKYWNDLLERYPGLRKAVEDFKRAAEQFEKKIEDWLEHLVKSGGNLLDQFVDSIESTEYEAYLNSVYEFLVDFTVENLEEFVEHILDTEDQEELEVWKEYLPYEKLKELARELSDYMKKRAKDIDDPESLKRVVRLANEAFHEMLSKMVNFDPEHGLLQVQVPLPENVDSIHDLDDLFEARFPSISLYDGAHHFAQHFTGDEDVLPPYPGFAAIVDSSYLITLDGHAYSFNGRCPYLLAADFLDRNFSLSVFYQMPIKDKYRKALILKTGGDTVTIGDDRLVVNRKVETEFDTGNARGKVTEDRIEVEAASGVAVVCYRKHDVCTVSLDGFYFGKTRGLLGTMNNEHYDEYRRPEGKLADNRDELVAAYKLDRSCHESAYPVPLVEEDGKGRHRICSDLFRKKWSSLQACFSHVDATPYFDVCNSILERPHEDEADLACDVAMAYRDACHGLHHVEAQMPNVCRGH